MTSANTSSILQGFTSQWSARPVNTNHGDRKWYNIFDSKMERYEKILLAMVILNSIYQFFTREKTTTHWVILSASYFVLFGVFFLIRYFQKQRFKNTSYDIQDRQLNITSWSLFGGLKQECVDLREVNKTYVLRHTDTVGSVLLYGDTISGKSNDLLMGKTLPTLAIQYVENPDEVLKIIEANS